MYYETINKEKLMLHKQYVKKLNRKREFKRELESKMGLKSYDYSKIKVINGDSRRTSEEERFILKLEKINRELRELEAIVIPEQKEIEAQLTRVEVKDWRYREILQSYYIDDIPAKEIIVEIYGDKADKDPAIWKQYYRLQSAAIRELAKVSEKPFIQIERQLMLEV